MKSYNDKKTSLLYHANEVIKVHQEEYEEAQKIGDSNKINSEKNGIKIIEKCIENIDEATKGLIGCETNFFIRNLIDYSRKYMDDFYDRFDKFCDMFLGNIPDYEHKNNKYGYKLGITKEDMEVFRGKNINDVNFGEDFKKIVNQNMGTNIPSKMQEELMEEYKFSNDIEEVRQYVQMKHDRGDFVGPGGFPYVLVEDEVNFMAKSWKIEKEDNIGTASNSKQI